MKEVKQKEVWIGTEDLNPSEEFIVSTRKEFFDVPMANDIAHEETASGTQSNRRDFLKYLGFSLGAAAIAASCDTPVRRAIPYVTKPDTIVPGVANYYASSFVKGGDYCPVLVKTREGRPIKIEGNKNSSITKGGTSARAQASVLELYDSSRLQKPGKVGADGEVEAMSWDDVDSEIKSKLSSAQKVRILSNTTMSPSAQKVIAQFGQNFSDFKHVAYDPISSAALLDANEQSYGLRSIPDYHFDKADVVVDFGADFLGTWISPVEYASKYAERRRIDDPHNADQVRMIAIESAMTLTGSNADNRIVIRPSENGVALFTFYNALVDEMGTGTKVSMRSTLRLEKNTELLKETAKDLASAVRSGKNGLVLTGSNNLAEQLLVNEINNLIGAYGKTFDFKRASMQRTGSDRDLVALLNELNSGSVDALFIYGDANPVFDTPEGEGFASALGKANLTVSLSSKRNETFARCQYSCPDNHNLESWGDVNPKVGVYHIIQPTISPLFDTRQKEESLLLWSGVEITGDSADRPYYQHIRKVWLEEIFPTANTVLSFEDFWRKSVHDGEYISDVSSSESLVYTPMNKATVESGAGQPSKDELEVKFYESIQIGNGVYADNPWLQEMPDPLYRAVWDNYIVIPVEWDGKRTIAGWKGLDSGDIVQAQLGSGNVEMPVVQTFGLYNGIVGVALGYGRTVSGKGGQGVGTNVYPMLKRDQDGYVVYHAPFVLGSKVGKDKTFASVQYHHTFGVKDKDPKSGKVINVDEQSILTLATGYQGALTDRSIFYQSNLPDLEGAMEDLHHKREHAAHLNEQTIYGGFDDLYNRGHKWEMSVDLSTCIGCSACQIACIAENNVPVVGKTEVSRHHEMTWLRIDRYFYGDLESPNVVYQPMMCQHCDNAPCENVCPVGATNHSAEGLNQMTYNRCIGTRYCANNCPYKVRRFNWLDYTANDLFGLNENNPLPNDVDIPFYGENLTRMVLNPDVTIRSRGVIEKCSFCVQRIQEAKLEAKMEQRPLHDGDINPACANACPTGAIVFGDVNNKETEVAKMKDSPLNYYALEEINARSSVGYKMKVINRNEKISPADA